MSELRIGTEVREQKRRRKKDVASEVLVRAIGKGYIVPHALERVLEADRATGDMHNQNNKLRR